MYNATNSAPHRPSLHRLNSLLSLSLLSTAQLNDLFVNLSPLNAPRRAALLLNAPRFNSTQFNSTICLLLRVLSLRPVSRLHASLRNATICLLLREATWLIASLRSSTQLNDLFVTSRRSAPLHPAGLRSAPLRNSTICLSIYYRTAALLYSALRSGQQLNARICLSIYHRISTTRSALPLIATWLLSIQRNSTN